MTSLGRTSENLEVIQFFLVDPGELLRLYDINSALAQLALGYKRARFAEKLTRFTLAQAGILSGLPEPSAELLICPLIG